MVAKLETIIQNDQKLHSIITTRFLFVLRIQLLIAIAEVSCCYTIIMLRSHICSLRNVHKNEYKNCSVF